MAQLRQAGTDRFAVRSHDFHQGNGSSTGEHLGIRIPHKEGRNRRFGRYEKKWRISIRAISVILSLVLVVTVCAYYYLSRDKELDRYHGQDDDTSNDLDFLTNVTRTRTFKGLKFGQGSVVLGRDSRYWDRDDRRRNGEYNEEALELTNGDKKDGSKDEGSIFEKKKTGSKWFSLYNTKKKYGKKGSDNRSNGLYNEGGRDELKLYEAEFEASMKNVDHSREKESRKPELYDVEGSGLQNEEVDPDDEYDDGIDSHDAHMEEDADDRQYNEDNSNSRNSHDGDRESSDTLDAGTTDPNSAAEGEDFDADLTKISRVDTETQSDDIKVDSKHVKVKSGRSAKRSSSGKRLDPRRRMKRHKYSGSSCEMKFLNSSAQLVEPLQSRKFSRFSLQYTEAEERTGGLEKWEPRFAGHQSLQEREDTFYARDQKINCGFIKGPKGSPSTGFDLAEDDKRFMSSCHIAVSSCIFGNSDNLRTPTGKTVTRMSRKNVCFVMFMDENTLQMLTSEGQKPDRMGFIGLWKIVVVHNLPFTDMRRVGKIPKFLTHRLFPSARYSIWLDSKLRLQKDPLLILELFLWRKGYEYAISNHYDRHCVWEEVAQNKKLNKFNHTIIDQQFAFYQADGLKKFNASDPNRLLPSYVPEGSFIVRAHTPMSNLFSCLWFNEVDRFTPRDQLSFAYTYLKFRRTNPEKPFYLNMFKDCERRAIAKLYHHRSEEKRSIPLQAIG